ncbi:MAG: hypothetical protein QNJ54_30025 [Prochloraceae cyanobacterium]|nr:hypothetical protein [Prochloraceae cyanobacterium]
MTVNRLAKVLSESGLQLNLSRERVRQIEGSLRRLRHPSRNRVLKEYLRASVIGGRSKSLFYCPASAFVLRRQTAEHEKFTPGTSLNAGFSK